MAKKTKDSEQNEIKTAIKSIISKTMQKTSSRSGKSQKNNNDIADEEKVEAKVTKKSSTSNVSKSSSKKATTAKKTVSKKATSATKSSSGKKTSTVEQSSTTASKKTTTGAKKVSASTNKKTTTRKKSSSSKSKKSVVVKETEFKSEYYDLPYGYNKTVVKVLAQTPKMLFIYWEISEDDRNNLKKIYGENFFEVTKPILIVYNDTLHYSFEVDINDFANSWYLNINDANCNYHVELGRRPLPIANQNANINPTNNIEQSTEPIYIPYYIYLTSSNEMTAPNNKILFTPNQRTIKFRNIKTGQVLDKYITEFTFITNFGLFNIRQLYKYLYPNENFEYENFFSGNPSSGLPSSGVFSSQFK